ncbi:hypothetical protein [Streptomyces venetus]|uniref:restriction endonuclease subunit S n=1 Tax=Streptomyces venetus TaxID=1701086 RepID=UPI003C30D243
MNWTEKPLGDIIQPAPVRRAGAKKYPILSMTMRDGLVDQAEKFKKRVASLDTSTYRVISRGQLVVGFPIDEGVLSFQDLYDDAVVSPAYDVWDVRSEGEVSRKYLERYLRSPRSLQYYLAKLQGSTARRRSLPKAVFLSMPVPVPPVAEQERIVATLDRVDALRAKRRAAMDLLDDLAQSIFLDMFGDHRSNFRGTRIEPLGQHVDEFRYGTSEKSTTTGYLTLRIPNVVGGTLDLSETKTVPVTQDDFNRLRLRDGDLLFVRSNGNPDSVGRCAIYSDEFFPEDKRGNVIYASYLIRARLSGRTLHPVYLSAYLRTSTGRAALRERCKTSAGQYNINTKGLSSLKVPVPSLEMQRQFARRVAAVQALKYRHEEHLASLDELLTSFQHRAFSGTLWDHEAAA